MADAYKGLTIWFGGGSTTPGGGHVPKAESQGGRVAYVMVRTGRMRVAARTFGGARTNQVNIVISDSLRVAERE